MANTRSTTHENPPNLTPPPTNGFNIPKEGRKYGIILGLLVSVYLFVVNSIYADLPNGIRFAKHLLIVPVIWFSAHTYANSVPKGEIFKGEIGLFFRIGIWTTVVIAVLNMVLSSINPSIAFEQFLNENDNFGDVMMNSFFVAMETLVFVVIIGFIFLQFYKRGGSPEDK